MRGIANERGERGKRKRVSFHASKACQFSEESIEGELISRSAVVKRAINRVIKSFQKEIS